MTYTGAKAESHYGNSHVYLMDCMDALRQTPDKYYDLAICDVPYGIGVGKMAYLSEIGTTVKQKNGTRLSGNKKKTPYTLKDWDKEPPSQEYFDELKRVSQEQIIWGINYMSWTGVGTGRIKWNKGVADGMSFNKYEIAYCSCIDRIIELPLLWAGMCQAKNLTSPMTQQGNKKLNERRIHPCHKPILLYQKLIDDYGFPGMKIIDTHLGSGSNRIAADKAGNIEFYGFEIDSEYYEAQEKRFKTFISQQRLF